MNFLGIGAQKAGSSWLDAQLRTHPGIWMPPLKELHYFDRPHDGLRTRLTHPRVAYRMARRRLLAETLGLGWLRAPEEWMWWARYLLGTRSDAWYASLFAPGAGRVTGEITPRYAVLGEADVAHAARALPHGRILYLLRDPVERAWSNLKMGADRYGAPETWREGELRERVERSGVLAMGRYSEVLARWERHFPSERIFVGFFDEIAEDPAGLLRRVFRFLGVDDAERHLSASLRESVNPGAPEPIPDALRQVLSQLYRDELNALHERLGSPYTEAWLVAAGTT